MTQTHKAHRIGQHSPVAPGKENCACKRQVFEWDDTFLLKVQQHRWPQNCFDTKNATNKVTIPTNIKAWVHIKHYQSIDGTKR